MIDIKTDIENLLKGGGRGDAAHPNKIVQYKFMSLSDAVSTEPLLKGKDRYG